MALKRWFKKCNGRDLHLNPPVTFCDKINWIKLYGVTEEMTRLSDKYLVRDWVKEKIGEEYPANSPGDLGVSPDYGPDDIPF